MNGQRLALMLPGDKPKLITCEGVPRSGDLVQVENQVYRVTEVKWIVFVTDLDNMSEVYRPIVFVQPNL